MGGLIVRLVSLVFAVIEAMLLIRLILPFVDTVPKGFRPLVVDLVRITDQLIAPFKGIVEEPFDLTRLTELPGGVVGIVQAYADRLDPTVVVAMIAWGLIGAVVVLALRFVFR
jgi:hypothetical protein